MPLPSLQEYTAPLGLPEFASWKRSPDLPSYQLRTTPLPPPLWRLEVPPPPQPWSSRVRGVLPSAKQISCIATPALAICLAFTASPAEQILQPVDPFFPGLQEKVAARSRILLEEDFSAGLGAWEGRANWLNTWTYDATKVMRPGRLALYRPSLSLTDYTLDLLAGLERQSLGWAVRATDDQNYIGMRLQTGLPGTPGRYRLERWTVRSGKTMARAVREGRLPLSAGVKVHIRLAVSGTTVSTQLEDETLDVLTNAVPPSGGVGLFSTGGVPPQVYRLKVTHQDDFVGRLCSFFPYRPITGPGPTR